LTQISQFDLIDSQASNAIRVDFDCDWILGSIYGTFSQGKQML